MIIGIIKISNLFNDDLNCETNDYRIILQFKYIEYFITIFKIDCYYLT